MLKSSSPRSISFVVTRVTKIFPIRPPKLLHLTGTCPPYYYIMLTSSSMSTPQGQSIASMCPIRGEIKAPSILGFLTISFFNSSSSQPRCFERVSLLRPYKILICKISICKILICEISNFPLLLGSDIGSPCAPTSNVSMASKF